METQVAIDEHRSIPRDDPEYTDFLARIQSRFSRMTAMSRPVFTTNLEPNVLFDAYLDALPSEDRQYHTCHSCRRFVNEFGGLVVIGEDGMAVSPIWDLADATDLYHQPVAVMLNLIRKATVNGVFLSKSAVWGTPRTGEWVHPAVSSHVESVYRKTILTAGQAMAEKREDFKNLITALQGYSVEALTQVVALLKSESLYRSEKCLGVAEWLLKLNTQQLATKDNRVRTNIIWRAVATAPPGFCHPRSSMIGTLLDDIMAGMEFGEVSRRFTAKMAPLQYQRPQVAPSRGNIEQAEKLVEELGIAPSLKRRFARVEEISAIWRPSGIAPSNGNGVFAHLKAKDDALIPTLSIPAQAITWTKFRSTIMREMQSAEFFVPFGSNSYTAIVTAVDPEAPPILQWDLPEKRNPFSWYMYTTGSLPVQWSLSPGTYRKVTAITFRPSMWGDEEKYAHQGNGVVFILDGCRDIQSPGLALFPEILKADLRSIKSTIEAFSNAGKMEGRGESTACGVAMFAGHPARLPIQLRVTIGSLKADYKIDRWD